jgi:hypothetical protein
MRVWVPELVSSRDLGWLFCLVAGVAIPVVDAAHKSFFAHLVRR